MHPSIGQRGDAVIPTFTVINIFNNYLQNKCNYIYLLYIINPIIKI